MYHNNHDGTIELHDDVEIESAVLSQEDGEPRKLTVVYVLRDEKELHPTDLPRLHSTNGVNHRYVQLPVVKESPVDEEALPLEEEAQADEESNAETEQEAAHLSAGKVKLPAKKAKKETE